MLKRLAINAQQYASQIRTGVTEALHPYLNPHRDVYCLNALVLIVYSIHLHFHHFLLAIKHELKDRELCYHEKPFFIQICIERNDK